MNITFLKELLVKYKDVLNCKYPNSMFSEENYATLDKKDMLELQLFENIINYLEEEKLKNGGYYE